MKRLCLKKKATAKRGVASLYVVIFATMLFGIVSLSCMRIMLSEVTQSSEDDLSRSAYDAAMAGVEDARTAVNRYYRCLASPNSNCDSAAKAKIFQKDCDDSIGVARYLYSDYAPSDETPEVLVQENNQDNNSDQAYTCVIVSDVTPDYRGTLTSDTRTRVIPLNVKNANSEINSNSNIANVKRVRFSWFSQLNEGSEYGGSHDFKNLDGSKKFGNADNSTIPPTITLTLIVLNDENNDPADFHKANNGSNYATLALLPSSQGSARTVVEPDALYKAGNNGRDSKHEPIPVECSTSAEFACTVDLAVNFGTNDSVFLVASLPYGETIADFSVSMYKTPAGGDENADNLVYFQGSQVSVDSTGRTGQLFRRIETRLEPSDLYFPYPMYALDLGDGGDNGKLNKDFWITVNCWYARKNDDNFDAGTCNNNSNSNAH